MPKCTKCTRCIFHRPRQPAQMPKFTQCGPPVKSKAKQSCEKQDGSPDPDFSLSHFHWSFREFSGVSPGSFRGPSGILPGSIRDPSGILPGSFRDPSGILPGSIRDPSGILPGSFRDPSGILPGSFRDFSGILPGFLRDPSGISPGSAPGSVEFHENVFMFIVELCT